jgi:hypothetical protein
VDSSPLTPPDLADLVARRVRFGPGGRRVRPFRFLLDSRVFRLLCDPGQAAAVDNFRASLVSLRLAPAGGLPELEMTPLAVLDVLGVEPPRFPAMALPKSIASLENFDLVLLIREAIRKEFEKVPALEPSSLERRAGELRERIDPAAHEVFDVCLTRCISRESFQDELLGHLTYDALFRFRFPEEHRGELAHLFDFFLLDNEAPVSGLTKMRRIKGIWDRSLLRILKKNPGARGEILAVDQEMKPRTYKDFLAWELIHNAVLGYGRKRAHPVIGFIPEPEDRVRARCRAHKSALRAYLDELPREEIIDGLRPLPRNWSPGWLVPCRDDGALEAAVSTGEVPVWVGV